MTSRRDFLEVTAAVGLGTLVPWRMTGAAVPAGVAGVSEAVAAAMAAPGVVVSPPLPKFVDTMPKPAVATPTGTMLPDPNGVMVPLYELRVSQFPQRLTSSPLFALPTTVWGYNGSFPGPTIEATRGQGFYVRWLNDLPTTHLLSTSIDQNVHGVAGNPEVRIVTHQHGGHVPWTSDGGPLGWYPRANPDGSYSTVGELFNGDTYYYPSDQVAATVWYHDHAVGITRLNVYAGLAGFWLLRDPVENDLNLPSGDQEIPIAIQDRTFNADGSLYYPPAPHVPEFFGDTFVVNGVVWPKVVVETKKYRFRLLNGCTARFLRMQLIESDALGTVPAQFIPGPAIQQIGSDLGLLPAPVTVPILTMGPGERCDVVIDFSKALGKGPAKPNRRAYYLLYNDAQTPFSNIASTKGAIPQVLLFEVKLATTPDTSSLPATLASVPRLDPATATKTRWLTLEEMMMAGGGLMALLNGVVFDAPVTEDPRIGTTEVWEIINLTPDTHPIHLHQTNFQVLNRQAFDVRRYTRARGMAPPIDPTPYLVGAVLPPDPNEMGLKDTVRANPAEVTRIIMKWEGYTGNYVWHCHILEHEDNEMMRPLLVRPAIVAAG